MIGQPNCEHAQIRVENMDAALELYTDVMGLGIVHDDGDVVYLSCGYSDTFDLAVEEGGTGLDHVAIRVADDFDFVALEERLATEGVEVERHDGEEPNVKKSIRFQTPLGASVEIVTVTDKNYAHSDVVRGNGRSSVTPLHIDHVTLSGAPVQEMANFLHDVVGLEISEVVGRKGEEWKGAFTRMGSNHHDLGFLNLSERDPEGPFLLRHVAWTMRNIEHMKEFIDRLAQAGHKLEVSIHRHYAGNNLAAYFWEPGGNRFEICAELATVPDGAPIDFTPRDEGFTAWGGVITPDTYRNGS